MADDSTSIGTSRVSTAAAGLGQVRKVAGGGGDARSASVSGGSSSRARTGSFGPRGNRMLPADYPEDQLDHRAARGTYLDILV